MQVTCAICEKEEEINDQSAIAKRIRNRPIHTYLCKTCNERIKVRTIERWETGKFKLYQKKEVEENW
ncbi:uncharacterized protein YlaI [Pullulanibacillus pueri]|uniref:DUF2197 domain-containing protein n=1 Tax=Pullulanibacillus pueri TaxID=1437324 RepID=A0A8J2ZSH2_9BACL|nr:YlaI family protein [Pullulanibacillus pueri]MBM7680089.1 uncharacterized protein YlaI [Pullulanibacillus pueri]GGH74314.1 hypothetical protein GCM10007096_02410 [Pullulanibacillus pueri]